jgi:hypothetical protein
MPTLIAKDSGAVLGSVSDADVKVLIDALEEEDRKDQDYFIDEPTIDLIELSGGSSSLVELLRAAVGTSDGLEVRWEK